MNEAHRRFHDWLTGGAEGDPPRDAAVHASVCAGCQRSIRALDRLVVVDTGLAPMPPAPTGREHSPFVIAGRLLGATAVLFSATILGVGVSQLIGMSPPNGEVAQTNPSPEQSVLAETATPQPIATPTPSATPEETLTPLGTPVPTHAPPGATPVPWRPPPTPIPTAPPTPPPPTPIPSISVTPIPTASSTAPTPSPSPTQTATPVQSAAASVPAP